MAELFTLPKARPLTTAGKIRPGSKLTFTTVGTQTEAAIYTNAACTIEHENPVVADANGEFAPIYLNAARDAYLTTAEDAAVWGPVTCFGDAASTEVSVSQYGADSTGTNDSYAAFAAAIAALGSSGGIVRVPKGTFKIATAIQLPVMAEQTGGIKIIGEGPWATRINFTGTGYAFTAGDGATLSFYNELHNFALYGTSSADGGFKLNGAYFTMVDRVHFRDFTKSGARGIYANTEANYHSSFIHNTFRNIPTGIYLEGSGGIGGNSNTIWRNWFGVHSAEAIHLDGVSANVIQDNEFNGSTTTAVRLTNNCDANKIIFNQMDGPTNSVVFTTNTSPRTVIFGNTGGDSTATGIVSGRGTDSLIFEPNLRQLWSGQGVIIGDASKPATSAVPLTVRGVASLGTYSFVVENSASSYLFRVNEAGATETKTTINSHGKLTVQNDVSNNSTLVLVDNATGTTSASNVLMELKGHASQSGDALQVQSSAGTVLGGITATGAALFVEQSDPSAPASNRAVLYAKDNGAGKTQLVVRFATGAVQVLATEP